MQLCYGLCVQCRVSLSFSVVIRFQDGASSLWNIGRGSVSGWAMASDITANKDINAKAISSAVAYLVRTCMIYGKLKMKWKCICADWGWNEYSWSTCFYILRVLRSLPTVKLLDNLARVSPFPATTGPKSEYKWTASQIPRRRWNAHCGIEHPNCSGNIVLHGIFVALFTLFRIYINKWADNKALLFILKQWKQNVMV